MDSTGNLIKLKSEQTTSQLVLATGRLKDTTRELIEKLTEKVPDSLQVTKILIEQLSRLHDGDRTMDSLLSINEFPEFNLAYIYLNKFDSENISKVGSEIVHIDNKEGLARPTNVFITINVRPEDMDINLPQFHNLKLAMNILSNQLRILGRTNVVVFYLDQGIRGIADTNSKPVTRIKDVIQRTAFKESPASEDRLKITNIFANKLKGVEVEA